jgi:hypothetical protein
VKKCQDVDRFPVEEKRDKAGEARQSRRSETKQEGRVWTVSYKAYASPSTLFRLQVHRLWKNLKSLWAGDGPIEGIMTPNLEVDWLAQKSVKPARRTLVLGTFPHRHSHSQEVAFDINGLHSSSFHYSTSPPNAKTNQTLSSMQHLTLTHMSLHSSFTNTFSTHRQRHYMPLTHYSPIGKDSADDHTHKNMYIHALFF